MDGTQPPPPQMDFSGGPEPSHDPAAPGQMDFNTTAPAVQARATAYGVQPQAVGTAIRSSYDSGIPPVAGMFNPQQTSDMANASRASAILQSNSDLAMAVGQSPVHAAATQNDLELLDKIHKVTGPLMEFLNRSQQFGVVDAVKDFLEPMSNQAEGIRRNQDQQNAAARNGDWLRYAQKELQVDLGIVSTPLAAAASGLNFAFGQTSRAAVSAGFRAPGEITPDMAAEALKHGSKMPPDMTAEQSIQWLKGQMWLATLMFGNARGAAMMRDEANVINAKFKVKPDVTVPPEASSGNVPAVRPAPGETGPLDFPPDSPVRPMNQPEVSTPPEVNPFHEVDFELGMQHPGFNELADILHNNEAQAGASVLKDLQESFGKTQMQLHAPEVTPSIVDTMFPNQSVFVDFNELLRSFSNGDLTQKEYETLPAPFREKLQSGDGQVEFSLGDYLAATSNHSLADVMNNVSKFNPNGVTPSEGADLASLHAEPKAAADESGSKPLYAPEAYQALDTLPMDEVFDLAPYLTPEGEAYLNSIGVLHGGTKMPVTYAYEALDQMDAHQGTGIHAPYEHQFDSLDELMLGPDPVDETTRAAVEKQLPDIQAAVNAQIKVMKPKPEYLNAIFENPTAVRMSRGLFNSYARKLEVAHKELYEKLVKQAIKDQRQWRTKEWQREWETMYPKTLDEILTSPSFAAYNVLRYQGQPPGTSQGPAYVVSGEFDLRHGTTRKISGFTEGGENMPYIDIRGDNLGKGIYLDHTGHWTNDQLLLWNKYVYAAKATFHKAFYLTPKTIDHLWTVTGMPKPKLGERDTVEILQEARKRLEAKGYDGLIVEGFEEQFGSNHANIKDAYEELDKFAELPDKEQNAIHAKQAEYDKKIGLEHSKLQAQIIAFSHKNVVLGEIIAKGQKVKKIHEDLGGHVQWQDRAAVPATRMTPVKFNPQPEAGGPRDTSGYYRSPGAKDPTIFYHTSRIPNIGTKENPWQVPPNSPHTVISFSEDPKFANDWKGWGSSGTGYEEGTPETWLPEGIKAKTAYIVHIKTKKIGDFRNADDLEAAAATFANATGAKEGSQSWLNSYTSYKEKLKNGYWPKWEESNLLWPPNGWEGVRMTESGATSERARPNICVDKGENVVFVFQPEHVGAMAKTKIAWSARKSVPKELLPLLPKGIWDKTNGADPDEFAANYGFGSKDEMWQALAALHQAKGSKHFSSYAIQLAKDTAYQRVQSKLGFNKNKDDWAEEAKLGVSVPQAKELLNAELRILHAITGEPLSRDVIETRADETFGMIRAKDAARSIRRYTSEVLRLQRQAEAAIMKAKPDYITAFKRKQDALLALLKLERAQVFAKEFAKGEKLFKKWGKNPKSTVVQAEAYNMIRFQLQQSGFPISLGNSEPPQFALKNKTPGEWQIEMQDNFGVSPLWAGTMPSDYPEYTVADWKLLYEMLRSWEKLGKSLQVVKSGKEEATLSSISKAIATNADAIGRRHVPGELKRVQDNFGTKVSSNVRNKISSAIKVETMLYMLDREQYGPLMKFMMNPLQDAKYLKADLIQGVNDRAKVFFKTLPKDWVKQLEAKVDVPELTWSVNKFGEPQPWIMTLREFITLARNEGTELSRMKLLHGYKWDEATYLAARNRILNQEWHYRLMQFEMDEFERIKPLVQAMYRQEEGIAPDMEKPKPIEYTLPDGTKGSIPGGYVKLRYAHQALGEYITSTDGPPVTIQDPREFSVGSLYGKTAVGTLPPNKHTLRRTQFTAPLSSLWSSVFAGLEESIHDVAYRPALNNALKIYNLSSFQLAVRDVLGQEYLSQIKSWLQDIAREGTYDPASMDWAAQFLQGARFRLTRVALGYKVSSVLTHGGIAMMHMLTETKPQYLTKAINELHINPEEWERKTKFILETSGEVRNAFTNIDKDVKKQIQLAQKSGPLNVMQEHQFILFSMAKQFESKIMWLAKYYEMLDEDPDIERAIFMANKAVRDTQGGTHSLDLPKLYRQDGSAGSEFMRLFYLFSTFENATTNRMWVIQKNAQRLLASPGGGGNGGFKPPGAPGYYDAPEPDPEGGGGTWVDRGPAGARRDWARLSGAAWGFLLLPLIYKIYMDVTVMKKSKTPFTRKQLLKLVMEDTAKTFVGGVSPFSTTAVNLVELVVEMVLDFSDHEHGEKYDRNLKPDFESPDPLTRMARDFYDDYQVVKHIRDPQHSKMPVNAIVKANETIGLLTGYNLPNVAANVVQHWAWDVWHSKSASDQDLLGHLHDMVIGGRYEDDKKPSRGIGGNRGFSSRKIR